MCKGLRQGNPLSLFFLSFLLKPYICCYKKAVQAKAFEGITIIEQYDPITHLQFADDTILFVRPEEEHLRNVKRIPRCFEVSSRLSINFKRTCLIGINVEDECLNQLAKLCGFKKGKLPFNYLGIPLGVDSRKVTTWDPAVDKVRLKLAGWKCRSLAFARRVILINSVLSTLPLYFRSQNPC
ncbi:hypothetical protein HRI_004032100 [Hibiscus trionum]|uniref:Reverse transcriptase domain-containing protein n=1 Tax=Hibiscus trionum TaxID=183268 RepID=A0A9W7J1B4_HIBTR|nr:hypothetical protein HRI_004032100 [Hibiscus trionum]